MSATAIACGNSSIPVLDTPPSPMAPQGEVTAYTTTADRSQSFTKATLKFSKKPKFDTVIKLDPTVRYQSMDAAINRALRTSPCRVKKKTM